MDVSKIESNLLRLNKEKVDLNEIISNVVEDYRNQIIESNRKMKLSCDVYLPRLIVETDKDRITQVVSNLLNNAVKFTKDDGNILMSGRKYSAKRHNSKRKRHEDYAQQIIQLLKNAELQHGIRLRILMSEQI